MHQVAARTRAVVLTLGASMGAVHCYAGDNLGFTLCTQNEECDAPPRGSSSRFCLHVATKSSNPGFCALPCSNSSMCAGEAPGDAEAVCQVVDSDDSLCVLPCSATSPCPDEMTCRSYAHAVSDACTGDTCVCFPDDEA